MVQPSSDAACECLGHGPSPPQATGPISLMMAAQMRAIDDETDQVK